MSVAHPVVAVIYWLTMSGLSVCTRPCVVPHHYFQHWVQRAPMKCGNGTFGMRCGECDYRMIVLEPLWYLELVYVTIHAKSSTWDLTVYTDG